MVKKIDSWGVTLLARLEKRAAAEGKKVGMVRGVYTVVPKTRWDRFRDFLYRTRRTK